MKTKLLGSSRLVTAALVLGAAATAQASILYQDTFTASPGTLLSGHVPDVTNGIDGGIYGASWNAATTVGVPAGGGSALWTMDGTGKSVISSAVSAAANNRDDANMIVNATMPFVPATGLIYDMQLTISADKGDGTSGNWLGMSFNQPAYNGHGVSGQALSNNTPYGLLILKGTGALQAFAGVGTANTGVNQAAGSVDVTTSHIFDLILNTSTPLWSITWKMDGNQIGTFNYTANPNIGLVSFGTNKHQGSVSAFTLSSNSLPEPTAMSLVGLGALGLIRRRK